MNKKLRLLIRHLDTNLYREVTTINFDKQKVGFKPPIEVKEVLPNGDVNIDVFSACKFEDTELLQVRSPQ